MKALRNGFTLIELLVVISIVGVLVGLMMPALGKARDEARAIACGSNLRQMGVGVASYIVDHKEHLPYVDSALFEPGFVRNWDADPRDTAAHPHGWVAVMRGWVPRIDELHCPDPVLGYPQANPAVTYRIASADSVTGTPQSMGSLGVSGGFATSYYYPFTYFNGRRYEIKTIDVAAGVPGVGFPIVAGAGDHYLVRDFSSKLGGKLFLPHGSGINQLYLDLKVKLYRNEEAYTYVDDEPND